MSEHKWIALSYTAPINPSKDRVYIWRKLKEFGAEYFKQGVALLPSTPKNLVKFRALQGKIRAMGNEATLVEMCFLDPEDNDAMVERFCNQAISDYTELLIDLSHLIDDIRVKRETDKALAACEGGDLRRMMKRYTRLQNKDYFRAGNRSAAEKGLQELGKAVRWSAADITEHLRRLLEKE